jgi:hypothetical protein
MNAFGAMNRDGSVSTPKILLQALRKSPVGNNNRIDLTRYGKLSFNER